MLTMKRLYLYGVLGVALVLLLWGLTDLVRFALEQLSRALWTSPAFADRLGREELSLALALVLVAGSIFGVHLALIRRSLRGDPADVADERASASRSTYFFLVLLGTGAVLFWASYGTIYQLIASLAFGAPGRDVIEPLGSVLVVGTAWVLHVLARRTDLRAAPARTAGDWLTRGYLYGVLFVTFLVAAIQAAEVLTTVARQVLDLQPAWESQSWWRDAIIGPVAATFVASAAWLAHWVMAAHLQRAPDPMGAAHRAARTRRGYFLAVVLTSAAAVLVLASSGLGSLFAEMFGVRAGTEDSSLIEDIGGPALMFVPFALAWWWHQRRVSAEALGLGGPALARSVTRTGRSIVAIVGLAGLSAGLAWGLQVLLDAAGSTTPESPITTPGFGDAGAQALALALVGFAMWIPAWALLQRDRTLNGPEVVTSTSRRAYLLLVSGAAVIAAMGSLAFLLWQATRLALGSPRLDDSAWAVAILLVAAVVLAYHLYCLRADLLLARTIEPRDVSAVDPRLAIETIEISAPAGADFKVLNAAIRSELPDGYQLRVLPRS